MRYAPWTLLLLYSVACGDALVLDDGTRVEGKAHKEGDQWIVVDSAGHETDVPAMRIVSFQLGSAESPDDRLTILRRSVVNLSDLTVILERYDNFIQANPDTPAQQQAKTDRDIWQQRADQHLVKIGPNWLTPQQRKDLTISEATSAADIADMIRQDRLEDAAEALRTAIDNDPQDAPALYLRGFVLANQDQVPPAREDFEAVNKLVPKHAPTLNNLAVMLWRQKLYAAALNDYSQAMLASPVNKAILDNVAEALNGIPDDNRNLEPIQRAQKIFTDQDAALRKSQSVLGQYCWGATWVDAPTLADLTHQDARNQARLDVLKSDYDAAVSAINSDDAQLRIDQQYLTNIQSAQYGQSVVGRSYLTDPSQEYLDVQSDVVRLTASRQTTVARLDEIRERAHQIEQNLTIPKFTGAQHLIGPEGTPIQSDATPATPPTNG